MMRLPAGLRGNLGLKLLSVALALLLWFFVHGAKVIEREQRLPIRYVNLPDSLMFVDAPPAEMRVLLAGPAQEMLLHVNVIGGLVARIDLADATPSLDRVVPSLADIDAPARTRVSVVRILAPSVIGLRLARRLERELPVRLAWSAPPGNGFCLADSPIVEPARVVCVGPEPMLAVLDGVPTAALVPPTSRGTTTQEIALAPAAPLVQCMPAHVRVTMSSERRSRRTLERVPLTVVPPARAGLHAEPVPKVATVMLAGPEPQIAALAAADVGLFVDASRLAPGRHDEVEVIAQVPAWIEVIGLEPASVSLSVQSGRRKSGQAESGRKRAGTDLP